MSLLHIKKQKVYLRHRGPQDSVLPPKRGCLANRRLPSLATHKVSILFCDMTHAVLLFIKVLFYIKYMDTASIVQQVQVSAHAIFKELSAHAIFKEQEQIWSDVKELDVEAISVLLLIIPIHPCAV